MEWNSLPESPVCRQLQIGTLIFSQREGTISALEALRDALVVVVVDLYTNRLLYYYYYYYHYHYHHYLSTC